MQTSFRRWLEHNHPEFEIDEGLLQRLSPAAGTTVGVSNAAIGLMGILGRLYTPFLGGPMPPEEKPNLPPERPPAMVAQFDPSGKTAPPSSRSMFYKTRVGNKVAGLTGIDSLDQLGSNVGEPTSQGWWDAADWISGHLPGDDVDQRDSEQKVANAINRQPVAMGPKDPPTKPRLTPRMRAKMRAKMRRQQGI